MLAREWIKDMGKEKKNEKISLQTEVIYKNNLNTAKYILYTFYKSMGKCQEIVSLWTY